MRRENIKIGFFIVLSLVFTSLNGASYDCKKASTSIEHMICDNHKLSLLDEDLSKAYKEAKKNTDVNELKQEQRSWIKKERKNCKTVESLIEAYSKRIVELKKYALAPSDENDAHLFSTAYYDIMTEGESTMMEYLKYSNRAGFDVNEFNSMLTGFAKNSTISIRTRVLVPQNVTTSRVYVSVGKKYQYGLDIWGSGAAEVHLNSFWNDKKQIKEMTQVDVKRDELGNRYVDYKLEGFLHAGMQGKHVKINAIFTTLRFRVAPVKRGFKNKFEKAKIYVLEE